MSKNKDIPKGRPVPIKYTQCIVHDWVKGFTFKDRLKIFLGYNLIINLRIACRHHPGAVDPMLEITTTKELFPKRAPKIPQ